MGIVQTFDFSVLNFINGNFKCRFFDVIMPIITLLGNKGLLFILIALILLFIKKTRSTGVALSLSLIIGLIVCNLIIKPSVHRIRPFVGTEISLLINAPTDYSFPSGHTTAAFEAATVMLFYNKKVGVAFLALAALIAFSRLYLYVHFPTDVLAGMIIGVFSGIAAVKTVRFAEKRNLLNNFLH